MPSLIIWFHLLFGSTALLSIFVAMSCKKGSKAHRLAGNIYVISMLLVLIAATLLSILNSNLFLFLVALFSGYMVYTGWRLASNRNQQFNKIDKAVVLSMLLVSVSMVGVGIWMYFQDQALATVISVFGLIGGGFALVDINRLKQKPQTPEVIPGWPAGQERIVLHITRIGGACIATITAVFVVNIQTKPEYIAWLLPTAIAIPLIFYWVKRIRTVGSII